MPLLKGDRIEAENVFQVTEDDTGSHASVPFPLFGFRCPGFEHRRDQIALVDLRRRLSGCARSASNNDSRLCSPALLLGVALHDRHLVGQDDGPGHAAPLLRRHDGGEAARRLQPEAVRI
jgi:hypothetical protein